MIFKIILFLIALFIFSIVLLIRNPKLLTKILMFLVSKNKKTDSQNSVFSKNKQKSDVVIEKKSVNNEQLSDYEVIEDNKANGKH